MVICYFKYYFMCKSQHQCTQIITNLTANWIFIRRNSVFLNHFENILGIVIFNRFVSQVIFNANNSYWLSLLIDLMFRTVNFQIRFNCDHGGCRQSKVYNEVFVSRNSRQFCRGFIVPRYDNKTISSLRQLFNGSLSHGDTPLL